MTNFDETYDGEMTVLQDRFGNAWFVKDARVEVSRGLQHSFHEETDAPTEGYFEKAWICHGDIVGKGVIAGDKYMKDSYEYMTVIHASDEEIGKYSSEPLGDYFAGPNHVLPTNGTAKFFSPLSVDDFIKKSSIIYYSREALDKIHTDIEQFAEAEQLTAHANSIRVRFDDPDGGDGKDE